MYVGVDTNHTLGSIPAKVVSIKQYDDNKHQPDDEINLYDITVEGCHRYCASDVLASNSGFDRNAVLAHGATAVIKDAMTIRGTKNEDYWNKLRLGLPLPEPGVPFIYDKFLNTLKAGGINVVEKGNITQIMPMTDKDIDTLSGGRTIENSSHLDSDFEPIRGGLFDLGKTGGAAGNHWSAIKLPEPVPNPIMEEPVRRVLGLSVKQLEGVLAGREQLNGKTGGAAIKEALAGVNIDKKIAECRDRIRNQRGANRDDAIKILGYLTSMKEQGATPQDWMISKVPVLPPKFRPISRMGDVALVSDLNELYRDVIENANSYTELHKELGDEGTHDERLNIYNSVKAAFGLGQSITPEGQAKNIKGAIRQVVGDNPKFGMAQSKVLSKTVDIVGRGVVTPDPDLDMDQVGIPEKAAWEIYRPFVMRGLVRRGYPPVQAIKLMDEKHNIAKQLLEEEMSRRPVLMDRAPTWHKFNIMAFTPHIVEGNTVRVCPLVVSGFNMDFDGDSNVCSARVYAKSGVLESAMYGIKKTALQSIKNLIH
jgi:DNA-directed RNA polymerase beta' subunit